MTATLEEATEFKVVTLNDLLEADARDGAAVGGYDDKYRKWFFVSAAAAGLFAVMFVAALVTGGGGDGGGSGGKTQTAEPPKGTTELPLAVSPSRVGGKLNAGDKLSVTTTGDDGALVILAQEATVTSVSEEEIGGIPQLSFTLAVTEAEYPGISAVETKAMKFVKGPVTAPTTATTAPTAEVPEEPVPEAPVPVDPAATPPA